jgi:hypothetical protein
MNNVSQEQNRKQVNDQVVFDPPSSSDSQDHWRSRRMMRGGRTHNNIIGGLILITVGFLLMVRSMTGFYLENWWALFILLPAIGSFSNAWRAYQQAEGMFTSEVRGSLLSGFLPGRRQRLM